MKKSFALLVIAASMIAMTGVAEAASNPIVFKSVPSQLPGNMPSIGFQATQTGQVGDAIRLAPGKRRLKAVTVVMSSWACQTGGWSTGDCASTPGATFKQPITLTLYGYGSGGAVGPVIARKTQTFAIGYRPTTNEAKCPGTPATQWYSKHDRKCYSGYAQQIRFDLGKRNLKLPTWLIYGISYNTSGYGAHPYGYATTCSSSTAGCPYDSLNVAAAAGLPARGQDMYPSGIYQDSQTPGNFCDNGTAGTGTFRLDDGCWTGYNPLVQIRVKR
ncbi:MAG TPA: hypothetical protein VK646_12640 [Actinomycetota bacterium]|nr:hypothetical protein [Actinomycetota bacterium]